MTTSQPVHSSFRFLTVAAWAACGLGSSLFGAAPALPAAPVAAIRNTSVADLVILGGGFDAGLRQGMVCRVTRGSIDVAEVLLVDLRPSCSSALILSVAPQQSIRAGDVASAKILKS